MKVDELTQKIEEASGLSIDELPRMSGFVWFGSVEFDATTKSVKPTPPIVVASGQEFPLKAGAIVYAMFQDNEVVRVYTLSRDPAKASPPSRYTLTKAASTYGAEVMSLDTFIDEIAEEWQMVAGLDDLEDPDEPELEDEKQPEAGGASATASTPATLTP